MSVSFSLEMRELILHKTTIHISPKSAIVPPSSPVLFIFSSQAFVLFLFPLLFGRLRQPAGAERMWIATTNTYSAFLFSFWYFEKCMPPDNVQTKSKGASKRREWRGECSIERLRRTNRPTSRGLPLNWSQNKSAYPQFLFLKENIF